MIRRCAWCGKVIEIVQPLEDSEVAHGICYRCYAVFFPNVKPLPTPIDRLHLEPIPSAARQLASLSKPEA